MTQFCYANFSVTYICKFLQLSKLDAKLNEKVPKDRLVRIVSRLYNEMN